MARQTKPVGVQLPTAFKEAFDEACRKAGRTPSQVARALFLDFCRQQGVAVEFDEDSMREGFPAGRPWSQNRRRKLIAA